ncbi:Halomucin [Frankliniella fusca]|uniref:Halomucin n=1 Tax=Frankliniella fusca TaxID=407009 RepID=A0AAE1H298_9NEOP|nr:Halomucin [Frankliniella fusca]
MKILFMIAVCGYIKTINRVKLLLSENPSAVFASQVNQSYPENAYKYSALLEYFTQDVLDSYSDYEKDAFLIRLERYKVMCASGGPSMSNPSGVNGPINNPINSPKRRKLTQTGGDQISSRSSGMIQSLSNSSERTQTHSNSSTATVNTVSCKKTNSSALTDDTTDDNEISFYDDSLNVRENNIDYSDFSVQNEDDNDDDDDDDNGDDSNKENNTGECRSYRVSSFLKDSDSLKELKPHLITFNVEEILEKNKQCKKFVPHLKDGWVLAEKSRKLMCRVLMRHICWSYKKHPNEVTMGMREGLAKSLVVTYPQYQRPFEIKGKDPWSSVLQNFNNVMKRIQDALPEDERPSKKNRTKSKTKKGAASTSSSVNIVALGIMNPDRQNKATILDGMASMYELRCNRRRKGESITKILEDFPQFVNYSGEVISEEFPRMYPEAKSMCAKFLELSPKIKELWLSKIPITLQFEDVKKKKLLIVTETLIACIALAYHLPHPLNARTGPRSRRQRRAVHISSAPNLSKLIVLKGPDVSITTFVEEKRLEAKQAVQPYLIGIVSPISKKILKFFLVLDSKAIDLHAIPSVRALALLFKSYFVFGVHYPATWSLFFCFLRTCPYNIFESASDEAPPSCVEAYRLITSS